MAEQLKKLFSKDIQKNLFPDNSFYKNSKFDGTAQADQKTVQIPQSGANPTAEFDPTSFPLTIENRTDDVKEYSLHVFATRPQRIEVSNELVVNYDKRTDMLENVYKTINNNYAKFLLQAWAPDGDITSRIIRTTGASRPATVGSGNRKKVILNDLLNAFEEMNGDDVEMDGRFMVVSAGMYRDLLEINEFISVDYNRVQPLVNGSIGQILGIPVFMRSKGAVYDNAGAPLKKTWNASVGADDNEAILIYHRDYVRRAEGTVTTFMNMNDPELLGHSFNAMIHAGGTYGRNDQKGIISIVQTAV